MKAALILGMLLLGSASASVSKSRGQQMGVQLKAQISANDVATSVCNLCQFVVGDIQDAVVGYKTDLLQKEVTEYLNGLCAKETGGAEPANRICEDVVRRGISTAVAGVNGLKTDSLAICRAVSICPVPRCPTGWTPQVWHPEVCYKSIGDGLTYPNARANCTAQGASICSHNQLFEFNAAELTALPTTQPLWLGSYFAYEKFEVDSTATDPRIFSRLEVGSDPFYQAYVDFAGGLALQATPWFNVLASESSGSNALLPYTFTLTDEAFFANALCCKAAQ